MRSYAGLFLSASSLVKIASTDISALDSRGQEDLRVLAAESWRNVILFS